MKNIISNITKTTEKNREKLLAYTTLSHNLPSSSSNNYNTGILPYRAWEEESRNWKLR